MADPADSIRERLRALREAYRAQMPEKVSQIEEVWSSLLKDSGERDDLDAVLRLVHTLAGSSASFGLKEVSAAARSLEEELKTAVEKGYDSRRVASLPVSALLEKLKEVCGGSCQDAEEATREAGETKFPGGTLEGGPPPERKTIFLVEDDPVLLESLSLQIGHFGYEVQGFSALAPAREEARRSFPAAIIMDMSFPEGVFAGAETVAAVQRGREERIPIIFISSRNDFTSHLQAARAGADAYFAKPVNVGVLIDKLDMITRKEVVEPYRILIVDDDADLASYHALILQEAGMTTFVVTDPLQVVSSLSRFNPDLILMDMYMPECGGQELATIIRWMDTYVSIPIVFLSAETNLSKQLSAMSTGGDDFLTKPIRPEHLIASVTMRAERMRIIRSFMDRDSLTGLLNHTKTKEQLEICLERVKRQKGRLAFAMVDIDRFRKVNDTYGHPVGDRVLLSLSRLFQQRLRKTDIIGRYGGEEFAVILNDIDAPGAAKVLDALRISFSGIRHHGEGGEFSVTFSCGIASFPGYGDPAQLSNAADKALYEAKNSGRNRVVIK